MKIQNRTVTLLQFNTPPHRPIYEVRWTYPVTAPNKIQLEDRVDYVHYRNDDPNAGLEIDAVKCGCISRGGFVLFPLDKPE